MAYIATKLKTHFTDKNGKIQPIPLFILGEKQNDYYNEIYKFINETRNANDFVGDPGTGKSHFLKQIAVQYAIDHNCDALWVQADPETMRSSFIGGNRFVNGSEAAVLASVGIALKEGHIVVVDELTHADSSVQTGFNSATDADAYFNVGDISVEGHPQARILFGHNGTLFPGNSGLMTSFAFRMAYWPFDYPPPMEEATIALNIAARLLGGGSIARGAKKIKTPEGVVRFLVSWARHIREYTGNKMPVSARNVALMVQLLSMLEPDTSADVPEDWVATQSGEPIRKMVAERIYFEGIKSDDDLHVPLINDTLKYIAGIGREKFIFKVKQACAFHANLENIPDATMKEWREQISASII